MLAQSAVQLSAMTRPERLVAWLVAWVAIRAVHGYKLSTIELDF